MEFIFGVLLLIKAIAGAGINVWKLYLFNLFLKELQKATQGGHEQLIIKV